jgi:hypothetical protein
MGVDLAGKGSYNWERQFTAEIAEIAEKDMGGDASL